MSKNYYDTLGVTKSASKDDIKKAFYKLAAKFHPDKKGGDEAKFKEINEAYQILSDDKKRKEYDTYGQTFNGAGPQGGNGFGGFGGFGGGFNASDFSNVEFDFGDIGDIFGDMFGGSFGGGQRVKRGRDISLEITIPFEEAVFGTDRTILLSKVGTCTSCTGSGAAKGSKLTTCTTCNGQGKVHDTKRTFMGMIQTVKNCDACQGKGKIPEEKCHECRGAGVHNMKEDVEVSIPAGISNGEMIRMSQMGEAVSGGTSGDLYIKISVTPHKLWKRDGHDLVLTHSIKLTDALLGVKQSIEGLDGPVTLEIPVGVSPNEIIKIKGRGVPHVHDKGRRGDILIKLDIQLPKKLSRNAMKLVEDLRSEGI